MARKKIDVIWYWNGGRKVGEWRASFPLHLIEDLPTEIRKYCERLTASGYVNHPGTRAIGPPDDAPREAEFRAVGV